MLDCTQCGREQDEEERGMICTYCGGELGAEKGVCMNCGAAMDLNPSQPWCEECIDD